MLGWLPCSKLSLGACAGSDLQRLWLMVLTWGPKNLKCNCAVLGEVQADKRGALRCFG